LSFWAPAPVLIAGPCVLEDHSTNFSIATGILELAQRHGIRAVFKASFDKANRASAGAARGPGIERGLELLAQIKHELAIPVLTDVHEVWQVEKAAAVVDAIQIPAFLCRQTDLLEAAGFSDRAVNIKKGQWMHPEAMSGAVEKVRSAGCVDVAVTERGSFYGYGDLVVDMRNFRRLRNATHATVLFDATHSLQQPGLGPGGCSGGRREYCGDLIQAAAAAGAEGFYLETHPSPQSAPCDSTTMVPLGELDNLIERTLGVWHAVTKVKQR
jgi:2-dehydro-3-deoxyphosphooctonate aldolase (KDO 8-P synthase)